MSAPCTPLVVVEVGATTPTFTDDTGSDPAYTGNNEALSIAAGNPTCCGEVSAIVGIYYNAIWRHDGSVTYGATVA